MLWLAFMSSASVFAQDQQFDWAICSGNTQKDIGTSITTDPDGNVITTGRFHGTVDFDPGPNTFNLTHTISNATFIQKLDSNGNFIWAKMIENISPIQNSNISYGTSVTTDSNGAVYVTGGFRGTIDLNPGPKVYSASSTTDNYTDVFVMKLSPSGIFRWAKTAGGNLNDEAASITCDENKNVYVTGVYADQINFEQNDSTTLHTSIGPRSAFVVKLKTNGDYLWSKSFSGQSSIVVGNGITVDTANNVYTIGTFSGNIDFDPSGSVFNLRSPGYPVKDQVFVQKLDANGDFVWVKSIGGTNEDKATSITCDQKGDLYCTGYFWGTSDFDPSQNTYNLSATGSSDIFIEKLTGNGDFLWAKAFGSIHEDAGMDITVDGLGHVYTTGYFTNTVDFDPDTTNSFSLSSLGERDIFIEKLDTSGQFVWAKAMGNGVGQLSHEKDDEGRSIAADAFGNIYTTGFFQEKTDFDPASAIYNLTSAGDNDVFIQKLKPCTTKYGIDTVIACGSFTWIDGITYTSSNNTATHTITNGAITGCDSIVTLNLLMNVTIEETVDIEACFDFYWPLTGEFYAHSGTYQGVGSTKNGCDSIVTLNLTIHEQYAYDTICAGEKYIWENGIEIQTSYIDGGNTLNANYMTFAEPCSEYERHLFLYVKPAIYRPIVTIEVCPMSDISEGLYHYTDEDGEMHLFFFDYSMIGNHDYFVESNTACEYLKFRVIEKSPEECPRNKFGLKPIPDPIKLTYTEGYTNAQIQLLDVQSGQTILETTLEVNGPEVDISAITTTLNPGLYSMVILDLSTQEIQEIKFVIE